MIGGGAISDRLGGDKPQPFNSGEVERLVRLFGGADYIKTRTMRERRGTSHSAGIRVAKGLYYRPNSFRSRVHEWEEDVYADTGLLWDALLSPGSGGHRWPHGYQPVIRRLLALRSGECLLPDVPTGLSVPDRPTAGQSARTRFRGPFDPHLNGRAWS